MADNRISLPSSGGGLLNYSSDFKSKIRLKPMYVLIAIIVFALVEIYLYKISLV